MMAGSLSSACKLEVVMSNPANASPSRQGQRQNSGRELTALPDASPVIGPHTSPTALRVRSVLCPFGWDFRTNAGDFMRFVFGLILLCTKTHQTNSYFPKQDTSIFPTIL